jgi:4-hydroxybenzoate polyprenyltransferase
MNKLPLCVDCDGTLLRTDLLHEAVFRLMKQSFFSLFLLPYWLLRGKAYMKARLADRVAIDAALLPYNEPVVDYLRTARDEGRHVVLATASHRKFAEAVARHLGVFGEIVATDKDMNLSGSNKAGLLVKMFGEKGFDYAGNSRTDLKVWRHAAGAVVVNAPTSLANEAAQLCKLVQTFPSGPLRLGHYLKALRPHQWLKNVLIFLPLLAAHKITDWQLVINTVQAFLAYGLCASSVYLLNDLLDLPSDREHPRKRKRPFASGAVPISHGVLLIPLLLGGAIVMSASLPSLFLLVLGGYYLTTLAYSIWLKNKVLVDVITLAGLYTFRIIAGAAATAIAPSFWLLAFSMFLFLSLALVKRYSELLVVLKQNKANASGRGYNVDDLPLLMSLGASSGFLSVLVMALYLNSPDVNTLYGHPQILWLVLPLLLYWISRIWMKTHRGEMHDDPVIFAVRDRISMYTALVVAGVIWLASNIRFS